MTDALGMPWRYWLAGGPVLAPLALVCLAMWTYFFRSRRALLAAVREGEAVEEELARAGGAPGGGRRAADASPAAGVFAAVVAAARAAIAEGREPGRAFDRAGEERLLVLRRDLVLIGALAGAAPLLGLLGTVAGMIKTFDAVAAAAGDTGSRVASGISEALITTQYGLVVAIPGLFGVERLNRLLVQVRARLGVLRLYVVPDTAPPGAR